MKASSFNMLCTMGKWSKSFGVGEMGEASAIGFCGGTRVGGGTLTHVSEDVGAHVGALAGGEKVFH